MIKKLKKKLEVYLKNPVSIDIESNSMLTMNQGMVDKKTDMFKGFVRIIHKFKTKEAHSIGVHFDSLGYAQSDIICRVLSTNKLPLYEIKQMLREKQKKYTKKGLKPIGVMFSHSNKILIKNELKLENKRREIKELVKEYNSMLLKKRS